MSNKRIEQAMWAFLVTVLVMLGVTVFVYGQSPTGVEGGLTISASRGTGYQNPQLGFHGQFQLRSGFQGERATQFFFTTQGAYFPLAKKWFETGGHQVNANADFGLAYRVGFGGAGVELGRHITPTYTKQGLGLVVFGGAQHRDRLYVSGRFNTGDHTYNDVKTVLGRVEFRSVSKDKFYVRFGFDAGLVTFRPSLLAPRQSGSKVIVRISVGREL